MPANSYCNIEIRGKVQDTGFRNLVEGISRTFNLRGMVFNDVDGTVKIVCSGPDRLIDELIEELKVKSINIKAIVEDIKKEKIEGEIYLPSIFFKAPTDELNDIGRKLDKGVVYLKGVSETLLNIKTGQDESISHLQELKTGQDESISHLQELKTGQDESISHLQELKTGQEKANSKFDTMISLLEKISNR